MKMMKKKIKPQISKEKAIELIVSYLDKGDSKVSIVAKINKDWQVASRTFERYWKSGNEEHLKRKQELKEKLEPLILEKEIEAKKANILTRIERMEIATRIARGTAKKIGDEIIIPSGMEQLRALDYLSKIEGDYAPESINMTSEVKPIEILVRRPNADNGV